MSEFLRKLSWLVHRSRKEADLDEEIRFHLNEETELRCYQGLNRIRLRVPQGETLETLL